MRLQKYMAHCGIGSRRKCEEIIKQGRVRINDMIITEMGVVVDEENDLVTVDDKPLRLTKEMIYIILHKPKGTITSVKDQFNRKTVIDQIEWQGSRIYPIGRLDYDTEGLIILTNDGELAFRMTHPRHQIEKQYLCIVEGVPDSIDLDILRKGVDIGGFITSPAKVTIKNKKDENAVLNITIKEGKNRQVRRMFEAIGHPVIYLKRERLGDISLNDLKLGEWRYLTQHEINRLKSL